MPLAPTCVGEAPDREAEIGAPPGRLALVPWGGPCSPTRRRRRARLTPTCVGRTALRAPSARRAAHPHVRGEDVAVAVHTCPFGRSPTCVGRTPWNYGQYSASSAHPHVRGEDPACSAVYRADTRLARAWGGRARRAGGGPNPERLAPTCVGRTMAAPVLPWGDGSPPRAWGGAVADGQSGSVQQSARPAHPSRLRGEDCATYGAATRGSPPRCLYGASLGSVPSRRLTPTLRGEDLQPPEGVAGVGRLAHVRGEDVTLVQSTALSCAAHPHVHQGRGLTRRSRWGRVRPRAWGGSSKPGGSALDPAHPHVRGEDSPTVCSIV